ncbi:MAG: sugar ABC transporter substrate-binding protein [Suipraeoptans sp.]
MKNLLRKVLTVFMVSAMVLSLAACGGAKSESKESGDKKAEKSHIYVLTAPEDHGWTGSVAKFAKEKIKEVNGDGKYEAELITSADAAEQITNIEDIISKGEKNISVVIQPIDDTVESAIQELADADIPFVEFDRIIDGVKDKAVSNVKGDNEGIGAGAAEYFVEQGLKPGDPVYVYEGDTSSVTTLRNGGFTKYLTGQVEFAGKKIDDADKWSDADLKKITYSGAMNWSRSDTKTAFESLMGDKSNAGIKWFYAEDDELAMGRLEALDGGGIDDATKTEFVNNKPFITGCGGLEELYAAIRGDSFKDIATNVGGIMSVTYSPSMIQTAIQDMVDHLNKKDVTQDHVIACENVTKDNVDKYPSF